MRCKSHDNQRLQEARLPRLFLKCEHIVNTTLGLGGLRAALHLHTAAVQQLSGLKYHKE